MTYPIQLSAEELARYDRMAAAAERDEAALWWRAGIVPEARVVDVGCGPGALLPRLSERVGPHGRVIGLDLGPEAVATAQALAGVTGLRNTALLRARAQVSGLAPGSADVVMLRHVLAHNGRSEQAMVEHAAGLLRPGGHLLVVDVDDTAARCRPMYGLDGLIAAYRAWQRSRGNDMATGPRLAALCGRAGLRVVEHRVYHVEVDLPVGFRGVQWAAREAMVADGFATPADVDHWAECFRHADRQPIRPRFWGRQYAALAVRES